MFFVVVCFRVPLRFIVFCWYPAASSEIGVRNSQLIYSYLSAFTNILSVSRWSVVFVGFGSIP
jgi:hypothetical protein